MRRAARADAASLLIMFVSFASTWTPGIHSVGRVRDEFLAWEDRAQRTDPTHI